MRSLALALTLVFSLASGAGATPVITNGLVAAYEFSGNADDVSGNGNDGVVNGATLTADRFGNPNSAYSFDGADDYIISTDNFAPQNDGAVSFWFLDSSSTGSGRGIVSSRSFHGYLDGDLLLYQQETGELYDFIYFYNGGWVGLRSPEMARENWHNVVLSWDSSSSTSLFIDGVLQVSTAPTHPVFGNLPVSIGRQGTQGTYLYHDGLIDDVYIYNRALSPAEVSTLYSAVPEPTTGLLLGLGLLGVAVRRRV